MKNITIDELYSIKLTIGSTMFPNRHDWEDKISIDIGTNIGSNEKTRYIRFKTNLISITIQDDNLIYVHGLVRKALKFKHQDIIDTLTSIRAELSAHLSGEI